MRSSQREVRQAVVKIAIQIGWHPRIFIVACHAIVAEARLLVVRVGRLVVVFDMTPGTRIWCVRITVCMTARAVICNRRMRST